MEYLLVMTLSGSTMTVVCLLLRLLFGDKISARQHYMLAKAAVLYYLIPLPFLKDWYGKVVRIVLPERQMEITQISLSRRSYTVNADGSIYFNKYAGMQIAMVAVWLSVAIFLMARRLVKYLRNVRLIAGYTSTKMTDQQKAYITALKEEYGIRRHVLLYQGEDGEPSMTFGIYRPVIICGREVGSREAELLIRHELVHIKRLDAFWKMLMQFVIFLHWCNPAMWPLYFMLDKLCELSCDETVMSGKTEEEVNEYLLLMVAESMEKEKPDRLSLRWKVGFGNNKREINERMKNLMKKKYNRFVTGTLVAALVFANSMTVFAYRDTYQKEMSNEASQEEIEKALQWDTVEFAPDGADGEVMSNFDEQETDEILYDRQFTDEEGNIYPIPEAVPYRGCNHTYVSGTETGHTKYSDGSCEVVKYRAQRCSKCGYVIEGERISRTIYDVCPH